MIIIKNNKRCFNLTTINLIKIIDLLVQC